MCLTCSSISSLSAHFHHLVTVTTFLGDVRPIWVLILTWLYMFMSSVVVWWFAVMALWYLWQTCCQTSAFHESELISFSRPSWAPRGQNEFSLHVGLTGLWQSPITAASTSHDLWPRLISSGWDGERLSESQSIVEIIMPADLLFNGPCPPPCNSCQVQNQTSTDLLHLHPVHIVI